MHQHKRHQDPSDPSRTGRGAQPLCAPLLALSIVTLLTLSLACGSTPDVTTSPTSISLPPPTAAEIQEAITAAIAELPQPTEGPTLEEISDIVTAAVAEASSQGATLQDIEAIIEKAIASALPEEPPSGAGRFSAHTGAPSNGDRSRSGRHNCGCHTINTLGHTSPTGNFRSDAVTYLHRRTGRDRRSYLPILDRNAYGTFGDSSTHVSTTTCDTRSHRGSSGHSHSRSCTIPRDDTSTGSDFRTISSHTCADARIGCDSHSTTRHPRTHAGNHHPPQKWVQASAT